MADKVTFSLQFSPQLEKLLQGNPRPIDSDTASDIGTEIIKQMKSRIAAGISPIDGRGKYERYKDPKKYPGKQKPKSPVNLELTGKFLDALSYELKSGDSGVETYIYYSGDKENLKEKGHRVGANGQPSRPTIPGNGEKFDAVITKTFTDIYKKRILDVLKGKG